MAVNQHAISAFPAKQVVHGSVQRLALDVPEGHIDRGNGSHCYGAAAPVGSSIQVLPNVLGLEWIAADQARYDVLFKIRSDSELAAVQGGVTQAENALVGMDSEGHKIPAGRTDENLGSRDLQAARPPSESKETMLARREKVVTPVLAGPIV